MRCMGAAARYSMEVRKMNCGGISKATLGRVPIYIKYLKGLSSETVSATAVAKDLGFGEVQVRKDLSSLCHSGKPKIGYIRAELLKCLEDFLGCRNGGTIIVGAGKLGMALLDYSGFEEYGLEMLAAFDIRVTEPLPLASGKTVYPMEGLASFCKEHDVSIGIIAVPSSSAQSVLNELYENGIHNICCFAPCRLYKKADVNIQYENMALSLAHLKSQINK